MKDRESVVFQLAQFPRLSVGPVKSSKSSGGVAPGLPFCLGDWHSNESINMKHANQPQGKRRLEKPSTDRRTTGKKRKKKPPKGGRWTAVKIFPSTVAQEAQSGGWWLRSRKGRAAQRCTRILTPHSGQYASVSRKQQSQSWAQEPAFRHLKELKRTVQRGWTERACHSAGGCLRWLTKTTLQPLQFWGDRGHVSY